MKKTRSIFAIILVIVLLAGFSSCEEPSQKYQLFYSSSESLGYANNTYGDVFKEIQKIEFAGMENHTEKLGEPKRMSVSLGGETLEIYCDEFVVNKDSYQGSHDLGRFEFDLDGKPIYYSREKGITTPMGAKPLEVDEIVEIGWNTLKDFIGEDAGHYILSKSVNLSPDVDGPHYYNLAFYVDKVDGWRLNDTIYMMITTLGTVIFFTRTHQNRVEKEDLPQDFSDEKIESVIRSYLIDEKTEYRLDYKTISKLNGKMVASCEMYLIKNGMEEQEPYSLVIPLE